MDIAAHYTALTILLGFVDGVLLVFVGYCIYLFRKDTYDFEKLVRKQLKNKKW